jgi:hypothetical protein
MQATDSITMLYSGNNTERLRITQDGTLEAYKGTAATGKTSGNEAFTVGNGGGNHRFAVYPDGTTVIGGTGDIGNNNIQLTNTGDASFAGNISFASGKGIDFSAAADTASGETVGSSLLDDYEEGTFTPTVSVEGQSNATTDKQYGRYVKVGKMVTVWCYIQLNGTPSGRGQSNAWQHGGLPFTKMNNAGGFDIPGSMLYWTLDDASNLAGTRPYMLVPRIFNNSTGGRIRAHSSDSNQSGQNASLLLKDNTEYTYTFTYEVA